MTNRKKYQTQTGRVLVDEDVERIAVEVETTDYDVGELRSRRRGRPSMGSEPLEVVTVRIDPELRAAISARAEKDGMTISGVHREALRQFLDVPESA